MANGGAMRVVWSPNLSAELSRKRLLNFILDGELVALDEQGRHSFSLLQNIKTGRAPVHFYLFDLLHLNGKNLMELPLAVRRQHLEDKFLSYTSKDLLPASIIQCRKKYKRRKSSSPGVTLDDRPSISEPALS